MAKILEENMIINLIEQNKSGSIEARDKLILHFMPKAEQTASEYFGLGVERDDLISSAYEGLILGIDNLKKINNENYISCIKRQINYSIINLIIQNYKLQEYQNKTHIIKVLKAKRDLIKVLHRSPKVEEISKKAEVSLEETTKILLLVSFNRNVIFNQMTIFEQSELSESIIDPEYNLIKKYVLSNLKKEISKLKLTKREKDVIELIFFEVDLILEEIRKILGLTKQRIFQIQSNIIKKIKRDKNIMELIEGISEDYERSWIESEIIYKLKNKNK